MKREIPVILCFILNCPLGLMAQQPWQQQGKLQVPENGHAIQHEFGISFLR